METANTESDASTLTSEQILVYMLISAAYVNKDDFLGRFVSFTHFRE